MARSKSPGGIPGSDVAAYYRRLTDDGVGLNGEFDQTFRSAEATGVAGIDELLDRLRREEFDLVAIGRSLIANHSWPALVQSGAVDQLLHTSETCWQSCIKT